LSDLAPNESRQRAGEIYADGDQVIWQMPNNTYLRMTPEQAVRIATQIIKAAGEAE